MNNTTIMFLTVFTYFLIAGLTLTLCMFIVDRFWIDPLDIKVNTNTYKFDHVTAGQDKHQRNNRQKRAA